MIIKEYSRPAGKGKSKLVQEPKFAEYPFSALCGISRVLADNLKEPLNKVKHAGVFIKDPVTTILTVLALWEKNITPVIINPLLPVERMLAMAKMGKAKVVFTDYSVAGQNPDEVPAVLDIKMPLLQSIMMQSFVKVKNPAITSGDVILFTSGTTAMPKAVVLSAKALLTAFNAGKSVLKYKKSESWLLSLPVYHIGGFSIFYRAYQAGQTLVVPENLETQSLVQCAAAQQVQYLSLVPTQLKRIMAAGTQLGYSPKAVLLGGAPASGALVTSALSAGLPVYRVYGSTETAAFACIGTPKDAQTRPASSGKPLSGVTIAILNEKGKAVDSGVSGEIAVQSESVATGYLGSSNTGKFVKGFYRTGDIGFIDAKGYLFVTGRKDDIINSGGEKIVPGEVQTALQPVLEEYSCLVFGQPDAEWGEAVAAVISGKRQPSKKTVQLAASALRKSLAAFMIPKFWYFYKGDLEQAVAKPGKKELQGLLSEGRFISITP